MRRTAWLLTIVTIMLCTICLTACESTKRVEEKVTLKIYSLFENVSLQNKISSAVASRHPNIAIEFMHGSFAGTISEWKDNTAYAPDIVLLPDSWLPDYIKQNYYEDLTPLIEQINFNTNQIEPALIHMIEEYEPNKKLSALPFTRGLNALYYNKNIFNMFQVPYPKDDLYWEEVIDLIQLTTGMVNGVQYFGFENVDINLAFTLANQLSVDLSETTEASDRIIRIVSEINASTKNKILDRNQFRANGNIAMTTGYPPLQALDFEWDMVTFPMFQEAEGIVPANGFDVLAITPTSKYKNESMNVIATLLSYDFQLGMSKEGEASSLREIDIHRQFGANIESLAGKNVAALFANEQSGRIDNASSPQAAKIHEKIEQLRKELQGLNTVK